MTCKQVQMHLASQLRHPAISYLRQKITHVLRNNDVQYLHIFSYTQVSHSICPPYKKDMQVYL